MIQYRHPQRRIVFPVRLSLEDFRAFLIETQDQFNATQNPDYTIQFGGTDGSEITTTDIDEIRPANERIPDIINQPVIKVSCNNDIIELRLETTVGPSSPFGPSNSAKEYVIAVQGSTQAWAVGAAETLFQWLKRRRTPLFRFYNLILIALVIAVIISIVGAAFQLHESKEIITVKNFLFFPFAIAALAFVFAVVSFLQANSSFSITVRDRPNYFSLHIIAVVVAIISGLFSILGVVINFFRSK